MQAKRSLIALTAVGLLALAACGGSTSNGSGPNGSGGTGGSSGFPGAEAPGSGMEMRTAPAKPVPGAKKGGTIYVTASTSPNTFDPTDVYYTDTASIEQGLVVRSLTQYVRKPNGEMVLIPDLSTNLGTHNKDFTSWTFHIRKGIKFSNGQPVTMADWKFGIERSFDRSTFVNGADYSNQYFLDGDSYKGPYTSKGTAYKGVEIHGWNLTIKMSKPFPDMPYWGAFPAMSPIPPGSISNPATYKNNPLATGPYKFASYTPGRALTLVKNTYWDPKTDPGRHQYVNEFQFTWAEDASKIDAALLQDQGTAQETVSYNNVLAADYPSWKSGASDRLITGSQPCTFMVEPDNRKITNVNVRRAIAYAFPYKSYWIASGSIEGVTWVPAYNLMPPGVPGRVQYNPIPGHTPGTTDAAKAKELLKKAGALGFKLVFPYETDSDSSKASKDQLVIAFKKAGFDPQPYATTTTNARSIVQNTNSPLNMHVSGWCSDWPSGSSWVPPKFQSTDLAKEGFGVNDEAFNKPSVDAQIKKIQTMPLSKEPAAWNALEKKIMTTWYPLVPIGYGADAMMRGSKIHNTYNDSTLGMPTWKDIWVG